MWNVGGEVESVTGLETLSQDSSLTEACRQPDRLIQRPSDNFWSLAKVGKP